MMEIKITDKILSIPPYVSTSWSRIAALHMKGGILAITLVDGDTIHISNLNSETIHSIFQHHAVYLEKEHTTSNVPDLSALKGMIDQEEPSIRLAIGTSLEGLGNIMQHNPNQTDSPDLPPEIVQKIGAIAKIITTVDELMLPQAELNCNCFYCQIARALNPLSQTQILEEPELEVSEKDLQFQNWSITQTGEKLYSVSNEHEKYNVYLGQPVGCTCGKHGCDHLLAVLKS
jgi:hypothetical protein